MRLSKVPSELDANRLVFWVSSTVHVNSLSCLAIFDFWLLDLDRLDGFWLTSTDLRFLDGLAILRLWNSLNDRERALGGRVWEKDCENDDAALGGRKE